MKTKLFVIISICGFLISCDSKEDIKKRIDDSNIKNLVLKYKASDNWNEEKFFTYKFQSSIIDIGKSILFKGEVIDIERQGNYFNFKVFDDSGVDIGSRNFIANIKVTPEQMQSIYVTNKELKGAFIINPITITTSNPSLQLSDGDSQYSYFSEDKGLMVSTISGILLDTYLDDKRSN